LENLKIDLSAHVDGVSQVRTSSPIVSVPEPDADGAAPATTTVNVSAAGFTDLSTAAALVFASMRHEATISAAFLKRALDAYSSSHDDEPVQSTASPAARYLESDMAAATMVALQPLLMMLRRPGL
jgi:hypothetical protein